jgi:nucleoside 2-deoxyribosyltransferase
MTPGSNRPSVYLAGPITGLTYDDGQDWREFAKAQLDDAGINAFSPLRAKQHLRALGVLDNAGKPDSKYIGLNALSEPSGITTRDRFDCMGRDLVLVNFLGATQVSIGTCIELGWADAARRPIVIAMEEDNIHRHAMANQVAGFIVPTLEDALTVCKAVLLP